MSTIIQYNQYVLKYRKINAKPPVIWLELFHCSCTSAQLNRRIKPKKAILKTLTSFFMIYPSQSIGHFFTSVQLPNLSGVARILKGGRRVWHISVTCTIRYFFIKMQSKMGKEWQSPLNTLLLKHK